MGRASRFAVASKAHRCPRKGRLMSGSIIVAASTAGQISTLSLENYLQGLFGPIFLGIVAIVAVFFLFTREITRFVQFFVLAIAIGVVFYTPNIVELLARGIATALGA